MAKYVGEHSYDYCEFEFGDDSEEDSAESSEDEIDIILNGSLEQRRHLRHTNQRRQHERQQMHKTKWQPQKEDLSSSEDEFEREMNAELDKRVQLLEEARDGRSKECQNQPPRRLDSGNGTSICSSEMNCDQGGGKPEHESTSLSNDDLLYDPDMDDEDQRWVDHQRAIHRGVKSQIANSDGSKSGQKGAPRSDAVLDCPACLTTLCIDCQRHEVYHNQYRAMFVMNCKVDTSELLEVPEQTSKKKFKSKKSYSTEGEGSAEKTTSENKDKFHPVKCEECGTVVGVVDLDEVYHFFNVLASYA